MESDEMKIKHAPRPFLSLHIIYYLRTERVL